MEIFNAFEIKEVAGYVPDIFEEAPTEDTEVCLTYLAEGLLEALKSTRSREIKLNMIKDFTSYAICSGMLISSRRAVYDSILLRDNTEGPPN